MAKPFLRIKAREIRSRGKSVREIAKKLNVSRSTASYWTRDIILSREQLERLRKQQLKGGEIGRLQGALKQKTQRLKRIRQANKEGIKEFKNLTKRELFITGVALYWAEGTKKKRDLAFCNSDPKLIQLMIKWLKKCFDIQIENLSVYVGVNQIHRKRDLVIKDYWSKITTIPLTQFRKTSFKRVENKKVYANFDNHYGTLTVKVLKPAIHYYKILGLIEGLRNQAG